MILSVYLHKYVIDALKSFGDMNTVVNKVLEFMDNRQGLIDYPECPDRKKCSRCNIDINYSPYLDVYNKYGWTSPRVSIRRILYYFVDNEIYSEDDWLEANNIISCENNDRKYIINKCEDVYRILNKIYVRCTLEEKNSIINMMSDIEHFKLNILREEISNETKEHTGEINS